jgi:hypothetical protein
MTISNLTHLHAKKKKKQYNAMQCGIRFEQKLKMNRKQIGQSSMTIDGGRTCFYIVPEDSQMLEAQK